MSPSPPPLSLSLSTLSFSHASVLNRSPNPPLYRNGGEAGAPPLSLPIGPGKEGVLHEGKLFRLVLRDFLAVNLCRPRGKGMGKDEEVTCTQRERRLKWLPGRRGVKSTSTHATQEMANHTTGSGGVVYKNKTKRCNGYMQRERARPKATGILGDTGPQCP